MEAESEIPHFVTTSIWKNALERRDEDNREHAVARERLRNAFMRFRAQAGTIANEISHSYPWLTVHGITHLDALWSVASEIAGPAYPLTPAEAFVLGGAFLIHDLGNGLAAYPQDEGKLQQSREWQDAVGLRVRQRYGRAPTPADTKNLPQDIARSALEDTMRLLHARHAAKLPSFKWSTREGQEFWLIEDSDIRDYYGEIIGRIAESHWWSVDELERGLRPEILTAPAWLPSSWKVDVIKVACLLRVADAAHLDQSRAPVFLRALRQPEGLSNDHWLFQGKLGRASREGDRLLYTSRSFDPNEAGAWWLCFETLGMVDRELRAVDELLVETHREPDRIRPRLAVQGVIGVEAPRHLARHVIPRGWAPVDARVHVSDVPSLVERLGGKALYGDEPWVPLRELIQNGADAIRARRILQKRSEQWGTITVRQGVDDGGPWVEVEDTGVGMSENVLTHHLLDFSKSFWGSEAVRQEHPGLAGSQFSPAGKFGIGFFSVFMWGNHVLVVTRRHDEGPERTRVLEFSRGLKGRPLLRPAREDEQIMDGGTRIRVWFNDQNNYSRLVAPSRMLMVYDKAAPLAALCKWIAPALDVDLVVEERESRARRVVSANDWMTLNGSALLARINGHRGPIDVGSRLRMVYDVAGRPIARMTIASSRMYSGGLIVVNGVRAGLANGFCGFILGDTAVADRKSAFPLVRTQELAEWATEQAKLHLEAAEEVQAEVAGMIAYLGGELGTLTVAEHKKRWLSLGEIAKLIRNVEEVAILEEEIPRHIDTSIPKLRLVIMPFSGPFSIRLVNESPITQEIMKVAADVWATTVEAISRISWLTVEGDLDPDHGGDTITYSVLRRPKESFVQADSPKQKRGRSGNASRKSVGGDVRGQKKRTARSS